VTEERPERKSLAAVKLESLTARLLEIGRETAGHLRQDEQDLASPVVAQYEGKRGSSPSAGG
jgi:hypothetical protein